MAPTANVTVRFTSCWNADLRDSAKELDVVASIKRKRWERGMKRAPHDGEHPNPGEVPLYQELLKEFLEVHVPERIGELIGIRPWVCRACKQQRAIAFVCSAVQSIDTHATQKDAVEWNQHVLTISVPIIVPCCFDNTQCQEWCERLCAQFDKERMKIDSLNQHGVEDVSRYVAGILFPPFMGMPGQKPVIVYSVHINPDLGEAGYIQKFPLYCVPAQSGTDLLNFTAGTWHSLTREDKEWACLVADYMAQFAIVKENLFQKPTLKCQECGERAERIIFGGKSAIPVPGESVFVSRNVAIPICGPQCHLPGGQRLENWWRLQRGDGETDDRIRRCENCNIKEPTQGTFKRCKKCKVAYYCGRDCQVQHWKEGRHKQECRAWRFPTNNHY